MTKAQQEIIDRIKKYDGIVVVTPYGMYSRFGSFIAFPSRSTSHFTNARNLFLKKFCEPFTSEERTKVRLQHFRNVFRYRTLAMKCLETGKYEAASKLAMSAHELHQQIDDKVFYRHYYKLKEGI